MYAMAEMQLTVYDFVHPFGGALNEGNRWVKLAAATDWVGLERQYAAHFHKGGAQALPVRMAFGSLVIRAALGLSDRQTVELIREDPYLQYFIGLAAFQHEAPFSAHSMAAFRKRVPERQVTRAVRQFKKLSRG
ncbi:transposase [Allofournierella sp.]|uniref:transposase n=1 Tax=Allofournierella sp. TaxID=1940256 RepID=UPI003AB3864A